MKEKTRNVNSHDGVGVRRRRRPTAGARWEPGAAWGQGFQGNPSGSRDSWPRLPPRLPDLTHRAFQRVVGLRALSSPADLRGVPGPSGRAGGSRWESLPATPLWLWLLGLAPMQVQSAQVWCQMALPESSTVLQCLLIRTGVFKSEPVRSGVRSAAQGPAEANLGPGFWVQQWWQSLPPFFLRTETKG